MKRNNLMKLFSALLIAVMVVSLLPAAAFAADVGIGIQEMIASEIANTGNAIADANRNIEYQFLYGDFEGKSLSPFETNSGDFLKAGGTDDAPDNAVWNWQWRCTAGKDTVLKITAKENMSFKIEMQENSGFHKGWAVGSAFRYVQENAEGERKEIKKLEVRHDKDDEIPAYTKEETDCVTHLAAGESLYIVYSIPSGYGVTDFCPWFTINTETYDATQNPFYAAPALPTYDIGIGIQEMIASEIANTGNVIADGNRHIEYQFLYGDFEGKSLSPFETNSGDFLKAGGTDDAPDNAVWNWQWRCTAGKDTVLKITAKENMSFKIEMQENSGFHKGWALDSTFRYVQENAEGERKEIKELEVRHDKDDEIPAYTKEETDCVTHLAAGESLYIVYSIPSGYGVTNFCPWFTINFQNYDETLNPFYAEEVPNPGEGENPNPGESENPNPGGPSQTGDGLSLLICTLLGSGCALAALPLSKKRWF